MKKLLMTALAVSTTMTLAMPFTSFAAGRSCTGALRPGNSCGGYAGVNAASVIQMPGGCMIFPGNAIDFYTLSGKGYTSGAVGSSYDAGCSNGYRGSGCSARTNCGTNSCTDESCGTNSCTDESCSTNNCSI